MNYRDTLVTCQECGKQFVFTVEKQRQMAAQELQIAVPDLCDDCLQRVRYGDKLHGRIKWFDPSKGYGFVVADDQTELFLHRDGVIPAETGSLPPLEKGQEVLYKVIDTAKGPQAVQVAPYP